MTASLARPTTQAVTTTRQKPEQVTHRESFSNRGEWIAKAHCRTVDPEELFVKGAAQRKAVAICRHCPVVLQCRADALDNRVEFGVWGGMTERQRRALLRKHPEIESWADFFAGQLEAAQLRKKAVAR
ncbi:WhiB family transcriptional regulator [Corynebacterium anserum]|uniref:Transcriptional regulator WhiB n=1 Tax=Corynebacterium anserum TaxID=2684406 RepID=A0A7G7YQE6_9CORY|nr:WhiB family transcriptional regulator [Corynebacterium anserum]MBC2682402.1 WhiB family transcriptional regulator [Corynebacterium anserum]QNH96716.1 WhiB family transcriptional regulator [Corynebacterium anserum]